MHESSLSSSFLERKPLIHSSKHFSTTRLYMRSESFICAVSRCRMNSAFCLSGNEATMFILPIRLLRTFPKKGPAIGQKVRSLQAYGAAITVPGVFTFLDFQLIKQLAVLV